MTGMFQHDFNAVPLNSEMFQEISLSFREGGKRVILNPNVNIWREHSETKPYVNVTEAFNNWYGVKQPHRPRKLSGEEVINVKKALKKMTQREAAEKYGVSVSTVRRLKETAQNSH